MELYTTLRHIKMALGGTLPPMTEIPRHARKVIDPEFVLGLGGFQECADKGLRCPVVGCGRYFDNLTTHINAAHGSVGGAAGVRKLMEVPPHTSLVSKALHERASAVQKEAAARPTTRRKKLRAIEKANANRDNVKRHVARVEAVTTTNHLNALLSCEEQTGKLLLDIKNRIGRSPSRRDAEALIGVRQVQRYIRAYGSWDSAKLQSGLAVYANASPRISQDATLAALAAYHKAHGDLPDVMDARRRDRTPLIPAVNTVLRAMNTTSWPEAMKRAASLLSIYGGRYGLPVRTAA